MTTPKAYAVRLVNDLESSARRFLAFLLGAVVLAVFLFLVRSEAALIAFVTYCGGYIGQGTYKEIKKAQAAAPPAPVPEVQP